MSLGVLLGLIPIPVPGIGHFSMGLAGGPLVVALVLGRLGRTGPLAWHLPLPANLTLRTFGLTLFLAAVGLGSGAPFVETLAEERAAVPGDRDRHHFRGDGRSHSWSGTTCSGWRPTICSGWRRRRRQSGDPRVRQQDRRQRSHRRGLRDPVPVVDDFQDPLRPGGAGTSLMRVRDSGSRRRRGHTGRGNIDTPFELAMLNETSRFHLVGAAIDPVPVARAGARSRQGAGTCEENL